MTTPSGRIVAKVREMFPAAEVDDAIELLNHVPKTSQSAERLQAAMLVRSRGDVHRLRDEMDLVRMDWRDTLVGSGFEHADHEIRLERWLGPRHRT